MTQRLFTLPEDALVYPAHDYQGFTVSTIGEEKQWNPRFVELDSSGTFANHSRRTHCFRHRTSFIELMTNLDLPEPQKMMAAILANKHCGNLASPQMLTSAIDILTAFLGR